MIKRLLLISNSVSHGGGYLDHCADEIRDFLGSIDRVLFVPYALADLDGYAAKAEERFRQMGYRLDSVHRTDDDAGAVRSAEAVFVGGGNTFRLLRRLYETNLIEAVRNRVENGMPYLGASAGANVACVTIRTTNDMPIVEPPSFDALDLVPFNINPHYLDPDPSSKHMGETREQRILEFLEENDCAVVGLREGSMLRIEWPKVLLKGTTGARLFMRDRPPRELAPGTSLDFLLEG